MHPFLRSYWSMCSTQTRMCKPRERKTGNPGNEIHCTREANAVPRMTVPTMKSLMTAADCSDWNKSEDFFKTVKIIDYLIYLNLLKGHSHNCVKFGNSRWAHRKLNEFQKVNYYFQGKPNIAQKIKSNHSVPHGQIVTSAHVCVVIIM